MTAARSTVYGVALALPVLYALEVALDRLPLPLAFAQSAVLLALAAALWGRTPSRPELAALGGAWLAMVAAALAAPVRADDVIAYVGYGILPDFHDAYDPRVTFGGDFATINRFYGTPLRPCVYGPLWLLYDRLLVHGVPTLAAGVMVYKVAATATLVALLALLRRLGTPAALLAVVALDPAFVQNAVADPHNDMSGVLLCLGAMLALRGRRISLAVALAAGAILVKITFVVVAPVVFAAVRPRRTRAVLATIALGAGLSAAAGGAELVRAIAATALKQTSDPGRFLYLHAFTAALALALAVLAFVRGRVVPSLAWTFGSLSAALYSWYLSWGIPYLALAPRSGALVLFAAWPLMVALDGGLGRPLTPFILFVALLAVAAVEAWRQRSSVTFPSSSIVTNESNISISPS